MRKAGSKEFHPFLQFLPSSFKEDPRDSSIRGSRFLRGFLKNRIEVVPRDWDRIYRIFQDLAWLALLENGFQSIWLILRNPVNPV